MTTATLIFAGIAGATLTAGILAYCWGDLRKLAAEIDRESERGFDLRAESPTGNGRDAR